MDGSLTSHYTSTACQHDLHDQCRRTCKYCPEDDPGRYCRCSCHFTSNVYQVKKRVA